MKITKIFYLLMFAVALSFGANLKVTTYPIPVMVESSEKGVFIDLVKEAAKRAGLKIEIAVMPPPRAVDGFLNKDYDMLFPGLDVLFKKAGKMDQVLPSKEIIYVKRDFAFTKKGHSVIKSFKELAGKTVGITRGYPYSMQVMTGKGFTLQPVKTDEINVRKLVGGRLDVFICEEKTGIGAIKKTSSMGKVSYSEDHPISEQDVYFAFQSDKDGKAAEAKFSKALLEMKKDGTFGKIMATAEKQSME